VSGSRFGSSSRTRRSSLFVAWDHHVPIIKVAHGHAEERPADLGIWRGSDAMALVADLKLIATDEWGLK
jgi:hypothetical protein